MWSKWADSFTQLISFINYGFSMLEDDRSEEANNKRAKLQQIRTSLAHNFSLLSALASHRLTHGDLARMRRRAETMGSKSSLACGCCCLLRNHRWLFATRQELRFTDLTGAFDLPNFTVLDIKSTEEVKAQARDRKHSLDDLSPKHVVREGLKMVRKSRQIWKGMSRSSKESVSDLKVDRIDSAEPRKISNITWSSDLVIIGEATEGEKEDLESFSDRTGILTEWINEDINAMANLCGIPPPILSRCYQELSNGMAGFNQTTKMADIPFPFPFTQLLIVVLWTYTFIIPMYVAVFTKGFTMTPLLTFGITLAMWSLCDISIELENPFTDGPNQLPVIDMHERFVEMLRTVAQLRRHRRKRKVPPPEHPKEPAAALDVNSCGIELVEKLQKEEVSSFSGQDTKFSL